MKHFYIAILLFSLFYAFFSVETQAQNCNGIDFRIDIKKGCSPLQVKFTAVNAPLGSQFTWDLGSGSYAGKDTTYKVFTSAGKYTVKLIVTLPNNTNCVITKVDSVEVLPTPSPNISVSPGRLICNGAKQVTFTDNTQDVVSREWVIDGVAYRNASATIKHTFLTNGTKSVTLKVTNGAGCTGYFSHNSYVYVYDSAKVDFCADIIVTKTNIRAKFKPSVNTGGRQIIKWKWNFPGGTPSVDSTSNPPIITYPTPTTTADVYLTVTTAEGCSYTMYRKNFIQQFIKVSKDTVCFNKTFSISNLAFNNGRGFFQWKLIGANVPDPPTNGGATLSYSEVGYYDFAYSFQYSQNGCYVNVSYPNYVFVMGPKLGFDAPDRLQCDTGKKIRLINFTNDAGAKNLMYTWYIHDSLKRLVLKIGPTAKRDTSFTPHQFGQYTVSLAAKSNPGCPDSIFKDGFIMVNRPKADFEADSLSICLGGVIHFFNKTTPPDNSKGGLGYKYYWKVTNDEDPSISYVLSGKDPSFITFYPGRYSVTMAVENSSKCTDTIVKKGYLTVNGVLSEITVNRAMGCAPITLTASAKIKKVYPNDPFGNNLKTLWRVDPEDGVYITNPYDNVTNIYLTENGCFSIYFDVIDKKGCTSQQFIKNFTCVGVKAQFKSKPACLGDTMQLENKSDPGVTYQKWFVEPQEYATFYPSDTVANPSIILTKDTCYFVSLTVKKPIGSEICKDTFKSKICPTKPYPDFTTQDTLLYCAPKIASFSNKSINAVRYVWDFGDGTPPTISESDNTAHVYLRNNLNGYNVTLTAYDSMGCYNKITKNNYVKVIGPEPKFSTFPKIGCDTLKVNFKNESKLVGKYIFYFNDGAEPITTMQPHTYFLKPPGKDSIVEDSILYYPTMVVADTGCFAYYQDTVKLYRSPVATFTADTVGGCVPVKTNFTDNSYNAVAWWWDLDGDGIIDDSTQNPSFEYPVPGKYTVTLTVKNKGGCYNTLVKTDFIDAQAIPIAGFEIDKNRICIKDIVNFTNKDSAYVFYKLDYGDGTYIDSSVIVPHLYYYDKNKDTADSVIYIPRMVAYNSYGCTDTFTDTIVVFPQPVADFTISPMRGCSPTTVEFEETGKHVVMTYWDFENDGVIDDSGKFVSHTFGQGYHTVKALVRSTFGCVDSVIKVNRIYINESPKADFIVSDTVICSGDEVSLFDISEPKADIIKWFWKFDDPGGKIDSSIQRFPKHKFIGPGYHNIMLAIENSLGCRDTIKKSLVFVQDTLKPFNPNIKYVTVNEDNQVEIYWNKSLINDFESYHLSRARNLQNEIFKTNIRDEVEYLDTDPIVDPSNESYCYGLVVSDWCNNVSEALESHCTILMEAYASGNSEITLEWTSYTGWDSVKEYRVYRKNASGSYDLIGVVSGNTFIYTDTGLCDQPYTYYVEAIEGKGLFASKSNRSTAKAPYLYETYPLSLRYATVENDQHVLLKWDKGLQQNVKEYIVDRYIDNRGWQTEYGRSSGTQFIDSNAKVSRYSYSYRVRPEDKCGYTGPYSNIAKNILLRHEVKDDKILLYWTSYKYWDLGVDYYLLQIRERGKEYRTVAKIPGSDTFFIDSKTYLDIDTAWCYRVIAYGIDNLGDTSTSNLTCAYLDSRIFVPTAFSPNNDTLNDTWKVSALSVYNRVGNELLDFEMTIFDRWGTMVFKTNDINEGWDGTLRGKLLSEDVYIYSIKAHGLDSRSISLKGNLTLLRKKN